MSTLRKVTVMLPKKLVEDSLSVSGKSLTETIRMALQQIAAAKAYKKLKSLRGKVKVGLSLNEMRDE